MHSNKRTLTGLLLALLSQLIHQDDVLLEQTYQRCLSVSQQKIHSSDIIHDIATVALKSQRFCFVILDGLDECTGNLSVNPAEEQEQVIEWFDSLKAGSDSEELHTCESCIRIFISGQRNGFLEERLSSYQSIQLEIIVAHNQDIESYAKQRSTKIRKKFEISIAQERDLVNKVTSAAKGEPLAVLRKYILRFLTTILGMFLYAKIVLNNLLNQVSKRHFNQELEAKHFPKGLDEAWVS
jgi:hypothetical protein